jgi:lactate permease
LTVLALTQLRTPVGVSAAGTLLPLAPVLTLLALLAVFRVAAWAVLTSNSVVIIVLAIFVWGMPGAGTSCAKGAGAATGLRAVVTGAFDRFTQWLIARATADIRVRTILLTRALGVLLEGLPLTGTAARGRVPAQSAGRIRCASR